MGIVTARQLKQRTGEIIKRVKSGERLTLTYRGKPIATIIPSSENEKNKLQGMDSFEEAWRSIEGSLERTTPAFHDWQEATAWVRNKNRS